MPCATFSTRRSGAPEKREMTLVASPKPQPSPSAPTIVPSGAGPLLAAQDLRVWFPRSRGFLRGQDWVRAVDGVSLEVFAGETLAVVGESGCGKTTLGRALSLLQPPTGGSVAFAETELTRLRGRKLRMARRHLQMIFQDPYASLDPE